jgi:AcrR family transcriptional regulator
MAELARELGISTRTLYRHFPSKAELVACLMDRWADEIERDHRARLDAKTRSPYREMLEAAELWLDGQCGFSATFWAQLERDFPVAWQRYQDRLRAILDEGRASLMDFIRDDLDKGLAMTLMQAALVAAADPERCEALGITRKEAVRQAIEVWVRGTLRPVRALHLEESSG